MGYYTIPDGFSKYNSSYKPIRSERQTYRVAAWHLPYEIDYEKYDKDKSYWFESSNKKKANEIEEIEKDLHVSLSRLKVHTTTTVYNDNTQKEVSVYPNGNTVIIKKEKNYTFVTIKDKSDRVVAEKISNRTSHEGRKILYKHFQQGNDTFTIVQTFSYDRTKNLADDVVDYGYTSSFLNLVENCTLEKEHYTLNGKEIKPKKLDEFTYQVKNENGEKLIFKTN